MTSPRRPRRSLAAEDGNSAVELAILLPVLLLLILGIAEFGRIYWARSTVQYALAAAARYAMVDTTATAAQIRARALASATGLSASDLSFSVDLSEAGYVSIQGQYDFAPIAGSFFTDTIQLQSNVRVPRS